MTHDVLGVGSDQEGARASVPKGRKNSTSSGTVSYRHFFLGWRIKWSVTEFERLTEIIEMPRYYFHIEHEGRTILDREGIELADLDEAREEAVAAARQLISDYVLRGRAADGRRFVITDEGGTILAEVSFRETIDT